MLLAALALGYLVEDPQTAGGRQPSVADQPIVGDTHSEVVASVHQRLADADASGEDSAVVLEHVVRHLHVVDSCLQLDAAGTIAVARSSGRGRRCGLHRSQRCLRMAG